MIKRGVLLIAVGHKNYIQMARNLVAGIRYNDPELAVALATDHEPSEEIAKLFNQVIIVPESNYKFKGKIEWIKVKTHMYDLTPFEETIFLDVDMIMLKDRKISSVFDQLQEINWTIANTGIADESLWADVDEVRSVYKTDQPFYNFHSEFVYFKKCEEVEKYFKLVKKIFCNPKITTTIFAGARMADELAFLIASMILKMYPHQDNYTPTFWYAREKPNPFQYLYNISPEKFAYSIGGHNLPNQIRDKYNNMASFYFSQLGLQSPYQAIPKKLYLKERQKN